MDRYSLTNLKNHFDISKNMKLKRNKSAFVRVGSRISHEMFIESVTESLKNTRSSFKIIYLDQRAKNCSENNSRKHPPLIRLKNRKTSSQRTRIKITRFSKGICESNCSHDYESMKIRTYFPHSDFFSQSTIQTLFISRWKAIAIPFRSVVFPSPLHFACYLHVKKR